MRSLLTDQNRILLLALVCGALFSCAHQEKSSPVAPSQAALTPSSSNYQAEANRKDAPIHQGALKPAQSVHQASAPVVASLDSSTAPSWGGFFWEIFGLPIALSLFFFLCCIAYVELRVMRRMRRLEGATVHHLHSREAKDESAKAS